VLSHYELSVEERDHLLSTLTEEQRQFVHGIMVRGKKTVFARIMAAQKGAHIPQDATFEEIEMLVDDWVYLNYTDAGVVTDALKCDCGRSLRYAHTVKNLKTAEIHTFGITHLELHTGIDAKIVAQIKNGFDVIDFELDEILFKVASGWSLYRSVGDLPEGLELPEDIRLHLDIGLPLLDRQLVRLKRLLAHHASGQRQKRLRAASALSTTALPVQTAAASAVPAVARAEEEPSLFVMDDNNQTAFDFFGDLSAPEEPAVPEAPKVPAAQTAGTKKSTIWLDERLREPVIAYMKQGVNSVRVLCELLIKSNGADDGRFSTGKPYLYVPVCVYLDDLAEQGQCRIVSRSQDDCVYQWL
jgi:hypothetical protein